MDKYIRKEKCGRKERRKVYPAPGSKRDDDDDDDDNIGDKYERVSEMWGKR